jgi:hypothetical protein
MKYMLDDDCGCYRYEGKKTNKQIVVNIARNAYIYRTQIRERAKVRLIF